MANTKKKVSVHYFEVYSSNGEYRWRLYSRNGRILASGESFKTKQACLHSIDLIQTWASDAEVIIMDEQPGLKGGTPHRKKWGGKK